MSILLKKSRTVVSFQVLTGIFLTAVSLFSTGCSPELVLGSALVASVLIAQEESGQPVRNSNPAPQYSAPPEAARSRTPVKSSLKEEERSMTSTPECRQILSQGIQAYERLEWNQAGRYFQQVTNQKCLCPQDQARVYLFWGAVAYQTGFTNQARSHFTQSKKLQPQMTVSKSYFPPPMVDFFQGIPAR